MPLPDEILNFDIDRHLNPYIPHCHLPLLPKPIRHFLGHRASPHVEPSELHQRVVTFLATVAGLCLVGGIGNYAPGITKYHPPVLIASLGASAILEFNTIRSPLAQPRNAVVGNTLAALCGVAITKLFQLNSQFSEIEWLAAAVGCAVASLVMSLTNTIHPPGGATAALASTQAQIISIGWMFVPIVLLDSVLMVCVALIFNNMTRQYPVYWWTDAKVGSQLREEREGKGKDVEEGIVRKTSQVSSDASSDRTLRREQSSTADPLEDTHDLHIGLDRIDIPQHVKLTDEELMVFERVQERMRLYDNERVWETRMNEMIESIKDT